MAKNAQEFVQKNCRGMCVGVKALVEDIWKLGEEWWIYGVDMWLGDGEEYPVPETWEEAEGAMSNNYSWPCADEDENEAYCIMMALEDADGTAAEDLWKVLNDALYDGAYNGWVSALETQTDYYKNRED